MSKITADLIQNSPQSINPLKERQLDLKGKEFTINNLQKHYFRTEDLCD